MPSVNKFSQEPRFLTRLRRFFSSYSPMRNHQWKVSAESVRWFARAQCFRTGKNSRGPNLAAVGVIRCSVSGRLAVIFRLRERRDLDARVCALAYATSVRCRSRSIVLTRSSAGTRSLRLGQTKHLGANGAPTGSASCRPSVPVSQRVPGPSDLLSNNVTSPVLQVAPSSSTADAKWFLWLVILAGARSAVPRRVRTTIGEYPSVHSKLHTNHFARARIFNAGYLYPQWAVLTTRPRWSDRIMFLQTFFLVDETNRTNSESKKDD